MLRAPIAPGQLRSLRARRIAYLLAFAMSFVSINGCRSRPRATAAPPRASSAAVKTTYPARPSTAAPPARLFHQTDTTLTLVTKPDATDDEMIAILYSLQEAARTHNFQSLGLPQSFIDGRKPIVWFHVYRGPKCASEKYADKLPCGASYHAAGEFTLGSYTDRDWNDGELLHHDNGVDTETQLWNPDAPQSRAGSRS